MIDTESKNTGNIVISKDSKKKYHYQVFNDKDLVNDAIKSISHWIKKGEKTETNRTETESKYFLLY